MTNIINRILSVRIAFSLIIAFVGAITVAYFDMLLVKPEHPIAHLLLILFFIMPIGASLALVIYAWITRKDGKFAGFMFGILGAIICVFIFAVFLGDRHFADIPFTACFVAAPGDAIGAVSGYYLGIFLYDYYERDRRK